MGNLCPSKVSAEDSASPQTPSKSGGDVKDPYPQGPIFVKDGVKLQSKTEVTASRENNNVEPKSVSVHKNL